jgi:hypothetical protein
VARPETLGRMVMTLSAARAGRAVAETQEARAGLVETEVLPAEAAEAELAVRRLAAMVGTADAASVGCGTRD